MFKKIIFSVIIISLFFTVSIAVFAQDDSVLGEDNYTELFTEALDDYNAENYALAEEKFGNLLDNDNLEEGLEFSALYYSTMTAVNRNQTTEAVDYLERMNQLGYQSGNLNWRIAQLYLNKNNQFDSANFNEALNYLEKAGLKLPVIPISIGFISYEELYKIGQAITKTARELDYKIAVIASGDLSHRLKKGAPAGFNPDAHIFDEKLMQYFKDKDFESILNFDQELVEKAGECGLRPIVTMLGTLADLEINLKINSYEGPFGVGYGTVFIKPELTKSRQE